MHVCFRNLCQSATGYARTGESAIHAGMVRGRRTSWDWHPPRDSAEEFLRSHQDVSETDRKGRYPAPAAPKPAKPRV